MWCHIIYPIPPPLYISLEFVELFCERQYIISDSMRAI